MATTKLHRARHFRLRTTASSRSVARMLVDVVESLSPRDQGAAVSEDARVERARRSFATAIESDDSLFECESPVPGVLGDGLCSADFVLRFRAPLGKNRQLQFAL